MNQGHSVHYPTLWLGPLLSLVDGRCSVDEILDMSGMADLDALRVLMQLLQQNVIKIL